MRTAGQSRASRVARGVLAGSFATAVAAVSHGLAHGSAPSTLSILVGLVFAGILGTFAIGRRPSLPRLAIVVAGSQAAFHLVFSWLSPGAATVAEGHHAMATFGPTAPIAHTGAAMWVAHALAAIATIVFLSRAEQRLWLLLADALHAVATRLPATEARPALSVTVPAITPRRPFPSSFLTVVSRRGPPATGFAS